MESSVHIYIFEQISHQLDYTIMWKYFVLIIVSINENDFQSQITSYEEIKIDFQQELQFSGSKENQNFF